MKDASDKFIKKMVRGGKELAKSGYKDSSARPNKKARSLTPGTDETIAAYPGSCADKAASPSVRASDQDLGLNVGQNKPKKG